VWKEIRALPRDVELEEFKRNTKAATRRAMVEVRAFSVSPKGEVELTADRLAQARRYDAANDSERTDPTAMAAIAAWRNAALMRGLRRLDERQQFAVLGYISGFSFVDMGEYRGVTYDSLRRNLDKGLSRLREMPREEAVDLWEMGTDGAFGEYDSGAPRTREYRRWQPESSAEKS
jgi:DNA-directed RNA polymerase specialized sigma24 family protein